MRISKYSRFSDFVNSGAPEFIRVPLVIATLLGAVLLLTNCGDPPASPPTELRGSIEISGIIVPDNIPADSILVILDLDTLGRFANPHTCMDVFAGTHLVEVRAEKVVDSTIVEYLGAEQVTVEPFDTTQVEVSLLGIAPDFTLTDIDGDTVRLASLAGKVALLYFFVST